LVKELLIALVKILRKNPSDFRYFNYLSKTPKIFQIAQKMREEMYFEVNTSDSYLSPNMDITDGQKSAKYRKPIDFSKLAARFARWRIKRLLENFH